MSVAAKKPAEKPAAARIGSPTKAVGEINAMLFRSFYFQSIEWY
jgi:hypothetical protein